MHVYVLYVMVYIGRYLYVFVCIVHMACIISIDRYWSQWSVHVCISVYYTYSYVLVCIVYNCLYL